MKINVKKLIDQVSKHPEIYNPDHEDFANEEVRDNIFNDLISGEMDGIKGEVLRRKWDQVLNKYANFIRKLSNDDSSEKVLERFMEWPWTKSMKIFKPYVRKQFKIPEFQSAVQIPDMNPDDLPDIPLLIPIQRPEFPTPMLTPRQEFPHPLAMPRPESSQHAMPRPVFVRPLSTPRQEFSHPLSMSRPEFARPIAGLRPEIAHSMSSREFMRSVPMRADFAHGMVAPDFAHGTPIIQRMELPAYMENIFMANTDGNLGNSPPIFQNIATVLGLNQPSEGDEDSDENNVTDGEIEVNEDDAGEENSAAKRSRLEDKPDDTGKNGKGVNVVAKSCHENRTDTDVLPNLPQQKPPAERAHADFTAQEHTFLAWAKTMSTFTAKRQATIKMQINKIMSEAEFEDLDDEFFAANTPPRRSIYTSRL